jgi:hypothetical protein
MRFEKAETQVLHEINDIVRSSLFDFFKNLSRDEGSSPATPQTASRSTTPGLTTREEPHETSPNQTVDPELDINYLLDDQEMGFYGDIHLFDYNPQVEMDNGSNGYSVDKMSSDSGYVSTVTGVGFGEGFCL